MSDDLLVTAAAGDFPVSVWNAKMTDEPILSFSGKESKKDGNEVKIFSFFFLLGNFERRGSICHCHKSGNAIFITWIDSSFYQNPTRFICINIIFK
jgi:hypothetical protein